MLVVNGKKVGLVYFNGLLSQINKGAIIVYQAIKSCFGKGYWIGEKPWLGNDIWK